MKGIKKGRERRIGLSLPEWIRDGRLTLSDGHHHR